MQLLIQNTTFIGNSNSDNGGALTAYGGYVNGLSVNINIINSTFFNNSGYNGGVLCILSTGNIVTATISNSIMKFNTGTTFTVFSFPSNSSLYLKDNIIANNFVSYSSVYAIGCVGGSLANINNMISGNTANGIELDFYCNSCSSFLIVENPLCGCPSFNSTICTTCLSGYFGPCQLCDCNNEYCGDGIYGNGSCTGECSYGINQSTNCTTCIHGFNQSTKCTTCIHGFNQSTKCTTCLSGFNESTKCTECDSGLFGYDCSVCDNCNHGECNSGINGDGKCICDAGYDPKDNCLTTIVSQGSKLAFFDLFISLLLLLIVVWVRL